MADNSNIFNNPLATVVLLMAAHTQDPVGKIDSLNQTIVSMREALQQINSGLEAFNTEVMPMFIQPETKEKKSDTRPKEPNFRRRRR